MDRQEQIERLQETLAEFQYLLKGDQEFLTALDRKYVEYLLGDGTYVGKSSAFLLPETRYRIHRDYKPEPDTPVFPGYVLCEVKQDEDGLFCFNHGDGKQYTAYIFHAPNLGCCGYVFKENSRTMFNNPGMFVKVTNHASFSTQWYSGYEPATLGWVAVKEKE